MDQKHIRQWGMAAENIAAEFLLRKGYTIRERNWRPKGSHLEIDIIAQLGKEMVFVEVKARNSDGIDPVEAVDTAKIKKIVRAANIYLAALPHEFFYRFDIITVKGDEAEYELDHIPDAFLPPLSTY